MAVEASSTFIENQAMYVLGGFSFTNEDLGQMFWIDLSTSWNTSSPAYRRLPDGYPDAGFATVLLGDQKTWFVLSKQTAYLYNLQTSSWSLLEQSSLFSKGSGRKAAVNPTTGRIYVPGGYSSFVSGTKMLIYDTPARKTLSGDMQPSLENLVNYSVVWAPTIKSMLLFGGNTFQTNITKSDLYAFSPDNGWRLLDPSGTPPLARCDVCLVPAYSGTKMVLFGGMGNEPNQLNQFEPLGDLYILDVDTMTWTRGSDAGPTEARFNTAVPLAAIISSFEVDGVLPQLQLQLQQYQTILPVTYHPQQPHHLPSEPSQVLSPEPQPASIASPPMSPDPNTIYVIPEEQAAINAQIVQADLIQQGYLKQYQAHVAVQAGRD
ncbi:MAG: hypothetical protein J3Q66DRAFT_375529 [Benniella sp.]|nr:MAG: hypothetical protein J3Q66DRAFT_375529 [Benniella sp.]